MSTWNSIGSSGKRNDHVCPYLLNCGKTEGILFPKWYHTHYFCKACKRKMEKDIDELANLCYDPANESDIFTTCAEYQKTRNPFGS